MYGKGLMIIEFTGLNLSDHLELNGLKEWWVSFFFFFFLNYLQHKLSANTGQGLGNVPRMLYMP